MPAADHSGADVRAMRAAGLGQLRSRAPRPRFSAHIHLNEHGRSQVLRGSSSGSQSGPGHHSTRQPTPAPSITGRLPRHRPAKLSTPTADRHTSPAGGARHHGRRQQRPPARGGARRVHRQGHPDLAREGASPPATGEVGQPPCLRCWVCLSGGGATDVHAHAHVAQPCLSPAAAPSAGRGSPHRTFP
jgi:hypothetical protein